MNARTQATPSSMVSRRAFLGSAALGGMGLALPLAGQSPAQGPPPLARPDGVPGVIARDETYWQRVAAYYRVPESVTNLEAGYWGVMAAPVLAEYTRQVERVNRESSFYARGAYAADLLAVRARVASVLGADVSEIALTRGATEALQCLIGGYNRLKPGDTVLYADLDYPGMQYAMKWLAERRGVRVARLVIPEPATRANVLGAYAAALAANPGVRLLLLTHLNNKTGLILPVAEITALARQRGADTIVDAAHSWGQIELTVADIGADFVGFNLHKWMGAPLGVGAMYIRKGRLDDVDRMMADEDQPGDSVLSRVHSGTVNFAAVLAIPAALDFHAAIGPSNKAARVRYLRDRWVTAVRNVPGIQVLTPDDREMVAAITSFRLQGRLSGDENQRIVDDLRTRHGLFTVRRTGLDRGDCVRVTPALSNGAADADRLASALTALARERR
jgi:selenocysteine lyase/cysteine desulfurase